MNVCVFADAARVVQREKHVFNGIELEVRAAPLPKPHFLPSPSPDRDSSTDKDSTQSYTLQRQGANTADLEASYDTYHDALTSFHEDSPKSYDVTHRSAPSPDTEMKRDLSAEGISGDQSKHLKASHPASVHDKAPQEKSPGHYQRPGSMDSHKSGRESQRSSTSSVKQLRDRFEGNDGAERDTRSYGTPDQSPMGHKELGHHDKSRIVSPDHETASYRSPTPDRSSKARDEPRPFGDSRQGSQDRDTRSDRGPTPDRSPTSHQGPDQESSPEHPEDTTSYRSPTSDGGPKHHHGSDYEESPHGSRDRKDYRSPTPDRSPTSHHRPDHESSPEHSQKSPTPDRGPTLHHGSDYEETPHGLRDRKDYRSPTPDQGPKSHPGPHYDDSPGDQRTHSPTPDQGPRGHYGPNHDTAGDGRSYGSTPDQHPRGYYDTKDRRSYPGPQHDTHGDNRNWHDHPASGHYVDHRDHYDPRDHLRSPVDAHDRGRGDYHDRGSTHGCFDRREYSGSRDTRGPQEKRSFDPHGKGRGDYHERSPITEHYKHGGSPARDYYERERGPVPGQYEPEPPDHRRYPHEQGPPGMRDRSPRGFPAGYHDDRHDHQPPVHEASTGRHREEDPSSSKVPSSAKIPGPVKGPGYVGVPEPSETEEPEKEVPCIIIVGNVPPGTEKDNLINFLESKRHTNVEEVQEVELKGKRAFVTLSKASGE